MTGETGAERPNNAWVAALEHESDQISAARVTYPGWICAPISAAESAWEMASQGVGGQTGFLEGARTLGDDELPLGLTFVNEISWCVLVSRIPWPINWIEGLERLLVRGLASGVAEAVLANPALALLKAYRYYGRLEEHRALLRRLSDVTFADSHVRAMLEAERFATSSPGQERYRQSDVVPELQLMAAVRLANAGQTSEASAIAQRLLARLEASPGRRTVRTIQLASLAKLLIVWRLPSSGFESYAESEAARVHADVIQQLLFARETMSEWARITPSERHLVDHYYDLPTGGVQRIFGGRSLVDQQVGAYVIASWILDDLVPAAALAKFHKDLMRAVLEALEVEDKAMVLQLLGALGDYDLVDEFVDLEFVSSLQEAEMTLAIAVVKRLLEWKDSRLTQVGVGIASRVFPRLAADDQQELYMRAASLATAENLNGDDRKRWISDLERMLTGLAPSTLNGWGNDLARVTIASGTGRTWAAMPPLPSVRYDLTNDVYDRFHQLVEVSAPIEWIYMAHRFLSWGCLSDHMIERLRNLLRALYMDGDELRVLPGLSPAAWLELPTPSGEALERLLIKYADLQGEPNFRSSDGFGFAASLVMHVRALCKVAMRPGSEGQFLALLRVHSSKILENLERVAASLPSRQDPAHPFLGNPNKLARTLSVLVAGDLRAILDVETWRPWAVKMQSDFASKSYPTVVFDSVLAEESMTASFDQIDPYLFSPLNDDLEFGVATIETLLSSQLLPPSADLWTKVIERLTLRASLPIGREQHLVFAVLDAVLERVGVHDSVVAPITKLLEFVHEHRFSWKPRVLVTHLPQPASGGYDQRCRWLAASIAAHVAANRKARQEYAELLQKWKSTAQLECAWTAYLTLSALLRPSDGH